MENDHTVAKKGLPLFAKFVILLLVVIGVRSFVCGAIVVKGSSMEPTFVHGDLIVVNKLAYRFSSPKSGDIVVCRLESGIGGESIVKRVIGLPGDEIDLRMTEEYDLRYELYINGELVEEPFLNEPIAQAGNVEYPYIVPDGCYFVMGDNRNASTDSRSSSIGSIPKSRFIGQSIFRLYPISRIGGV